MPTTTTVRYECYDQHDAVLHRPDAYIGSVTLDNAERYLMSPDGGAMQRMYVTYNPGLLKLFDEILVNAVDQAVTDPGMCNHIEATVTADRITVRNASTGIRIEKQAVTRAGVTEEHYIPMIIFGMLNSGSNFDDSEVRTVGGRNGLGAKCANIFSTEFSVEVGDTQTGRKFQCTWHDNMKRHSEPKVTRFTNKRGYVSVSFKPDLARFGMSTIDDVHVALMQKRMYDACACSARNVKISWQNAPLQTKDFKDYAALFHPSSRDGPIRCFETERWRVAVGYCSAGGTTVSLVNGIDTFNGGTHVDHAVKALVSALPPPKKKGDPKLTPRTVREHLFLCVIATLNNPTFSSQTKESCTLRSTLFGSTLVVPDAVAKFVAQSDVVQAAAALSRHRERQALMKKDSTLARSTCRGIAKLDDANLAGGPRSAECTLILTEGDSAKTFAVSGTEVIGRDLYGIFPLKGKPLNVKDASVRQASENEELTKIKQIVGLQTGVKYQRVSHSEGLRYGKIMICADADHDGIHIKGLVLNMIQTYWPELVDLGFVCTMITPIVKATPPRGSAAGVVTRSFFTVRDYERWYEEAPDSRARWKIKYFKGLGTSTPGEAREYFSDLRGLQYGFRMPPDRRDVIMDLPFKKSMADDRKEWISGHIADPADVDYYGDGAEAERVLDVDRFINTELVAFSAADVVRSIPSMVDGLKPSQRKVMFAMLKRKNPYEEVKVAQLSGYVSEHAAYHHGEMSLNNTIVNMAQDFVGSNNVPLLDPVGMFGSRLEGGKDAASSRYVFTRLQQRCRTLFHPADAEVLEYLTDDGASVEPRHYVPTQPLVLLNGATGIGTGWSTSVPPFHPDDVRRCTEALVRGEPVPMQHLRVHFRGFTGTTEAVSDTAWRFTGTWRRTGPKAIEITELPPRVWTNPYKEFLHKQEYVSDVEDHTTTTAVRLVVKTKAPLPEDFDAVAKLKLSSTVTLTNMHLFDSAGKIRRYETAMDILREWVEVRLLWYAKRREHQLQKLRAALGRYTNKHRFIHGVLEGTITLARRSRPELNAALRHLEFDVDEASGGYGYLLSLPFSSLTAEELDKLDHLIEDARADVVQLEASGPRDLMLAEL